MEVFLSAMYLSSNHTIEFLKKSGFQIDFISALLKIPKEFKISYERKLFILAITNMLFNSTNISEEIRNSAG